MRYLPEVRHIFRISPHVGCDERLGLASDPPLNIRAVQHEGLLGDIRKYRGNTRVHDSHRGGRTGVDLMDCFVAGPQAQRPQRHLQRHAPAAYCDGVLRTYKL